MPKLVVNDKSNYHGKLANILTEPSIALKHFGYFLRHL